MPEQKIGPNATNLQIFQNKPEEGNKNQGGLLNIF